MLNDEPADVLSDLRDYGVTEASKSVHPIGNPISHSTHGGFNCPGMTSSPLTCTARCVV
jgi:hypothetical protein